MRVLRRLLVVGLAWASLCAPAFARAGTGTVSIFYYPWYSTPAVDGAWKHWDQNGHRPPGDLYSSFFPALGPYSSSDPGTVDRQMTEIAGAGINEVIVSWWGRGSAEDKRLPLVASAARRHGVAVGLHLEPYSGRSPATITADLAYAASLGIRDVYVYHPQDIAAADWVTVRAASPASLRLFAGTGRVGFAAAGRFEGVYTYDFINYHGGTFVRLCQEAHAVHLLCAPSVGPGYDGSRAGEAPVRRPRRHGATYDALWAAALAASPDVISITSFNEWGESTQIEPAAGRAGYRSYDGAWGQTGAAAQNAYLRRTTYWSAQFRAGALGRSTPP
jgi:hypothetical protein